MGRPRFGKGFCYTAAKSAAYLKDLKSFLTLQYRSEPMAGALVVELVTQMKRPKSAKKRKYNTVRPDIDNFAKMILDACNAIVWIDDAQIVKLTHEKIYGEEELTLISVSEIA